MKASFWASVAVIAVAVIGLAAWLADRGERSVFASDAYDAPPPAIGTEFVVMVEFVASREKSDLEYVNVPASLHDPQYVESMILSGDAKRFMPGERFVLRELVAMENSPMMHARIESGEGTYWLMGPSLMNKRRCEPISSTP